jgi:hypothetical protein
VYGIITQSGGHISVASNPGQGTSFVAHLRARRARSRTARRRGARLTPPTATHRGVEAPRAQVTAVGAAVPQSGSHLGASARRGVLSPGRRRESDPPSRACLCAAVPLWPAGEGEAHRFEKAGML